MTDRRPFSDAYSPTPLAAPLRPATEARERAIALLTDGYAYDALTEAEFEWRLGELMRAESTAAIDALVSDLAPGRLVATGHDAAPVTAKVSPASLQTWGQKDGMDQKLTEMNGYLSFNLGITARHTSEMETMKREMEVMRHRLTALERPN